MAAAAPALPALQRRPGRTTWRRRAWGWLADVLAGGLTQAVCTNRSAATPASTTGGSTITSAITPASGELVVLFVGLTGATLANSPAQVTDTNNMGWTLVWTATKNASADTLYVFVSNSLATGSTTVTVKTSVHPTPTSATGSAIFAAGVSSMTRLGIDAVRQVAVSNNIAATITPGVTFSASALTGNPTAVFVFNNTNPATLTPPAGWTEPNDTGYATPTTGAEWVTRDNGFTGTAVTYGALSASQWGAIGVELDTSTATVTAPYVVAWGAVATANGGNITVAMPVGYTFASNDVILLLVDQADQVAISVSDVLYTRKGAAAQQGTALQQSVYWKRSTGSEASLTVTHTAGNAIRGYVVVVKGAVATGDPIEAISSNPTTGSATISCTAITTITEAAMVAMVTSEELTGNTSGSPSIQSYSGNGPTFSEAVDTAFGGASNNLCGSFAWGGLAAPGSTGARTATVVGEAATPTGNIGTLLAIASRSTSTPLPPGTDVLRTTLTAVRRAAFR